MSIDLLKNKGKIMIREKILLEDKEVERII